MDFKFSAATDNQVKPFRISARELLDLLGTDENRGLEDREAADRLAAYGKNEFAVEKSAPAWKKLLMQFKDVLVLLLLAATAISAGLWFYERDSTLPYEAIAILAVVMLNAVIGYVQEARAESAVAALRRMSAAQATVIRGGERKRIPAAGVVPGDIIIVEEGDTIPADARLIHTTALQTGEAALTGESLPSVKNTLPIPDETGLGDRSNRIFSGTVMTYGRGIAAVTATGMQTGMGRIAGMLKDAPAETSPLQKELAHIGFLLGAVVVAIAVVMVGTILLVKHVSGFSAIFDVLILGVALAVAAVPEGLPAVVTAVLSIGVQRMAKRNSIVRNLAAVETLGSANVIASDKTGTLTRNEMTVRAVVTSSGRVHLGGTGYEPVGNVRQAEEPGVGRELDAVLRIELDLILTVACSANNAVLLEHDGEWMVQGDPTEGALVVAARKAGLDRQELGARFGRIGEVPFSSERKLMSTIHTDSRRQDRLLVFTKGAPDVLLERCVQELVGENTRPLTPERRAGILKENEKLAGEALRTLGIAYRIIAGRTLDENAFDERLERELVFAGLVGMMDPPRPEAKKAVARARSAGIRPIMITGDHPITAAVIAEELGIADDRSITGARLASLPDEDLSKAVSRRSTGKGSSGSGRSEPRKDSGLPNSMRCIQ